MIGGAALLKSPDVKPDVSKDAPDLRTPGKIIVLEPSGNMVIRHLYSDLAEVNLIKNPRPLSGRSGFESGSMGMGGMGGMSAP